jgi:hypothetical protein
MSVLMQADIRYFQPNEIMHAWHWVKTAKYAEDLPVRTMLPPGHLMKGYNPEYTDYLSERASLPPDARGIEDPGRVAIPDLLLCCSRVGKRRDSASEFANQASAFP